MRAIIPEHSTTSSILEKANSDEQSRTAEVSDKIDSDKKAPIAPTSETKNSDKVIPTISETEGISATNEPTKMVFTNGLNLINTDQNDGPGFGVLEITSDDPLNFTASVSYAPLSLGFPTDYFDVNEGVSVT